jgi:hypothetical protein
MMALYAETSKEFMQKQNYFYNKVAVFDWIVDTKHLNGLPYIISTDWCL